MPFPHHPVRDLGKNVRAFPVSPEVELAVLVSVGGLVGVLQVLGPNNQERAVDGVREWAAGTPESQNS